MIVIRFLIPLIYSFMIGIAWSLTFKKKFLNSLAPSYMAHIVLVLLSGLLFERLSIGIYGGLGVTIAFLLVYCFSNKVNFTTLKSGFARVWEEGGALFFFFYVFCYIINFDKCFLAWDEFSHWGMFIKESYRLDGLYCMSPLDFAHKDYVPAVTLFETIWCKLNFRYAEADAYRAIQVFMFSMLMPMFDKFFSSTDRYTNGERDRTCVKKRMTKVVTRFFAVVFVLLIPLIFNTRNAFFFYHSIYCDLVVGIIFFWCVFESYKKQNDYIYHNFILTLGLTILVLSKMTAMALLPLVVVLGGIKELFVLRNRKVKEYVCFSFQLSIPVAFWFWFNRYVNKYVESSGNRQSYDSLNFTSIIDVFIKQNEKAIPYLQELKDVYVDAILNRNILIHGSYLWVMIALISMFLLVSLFVKDKEKKHMVRLSACWTMFSAVCYSLLMYFLYATAFSEYEALILASYERYMNSFVISVILLMIAVVYDSELWKSHVVVIYLVVIILLVDLFVFQRETFDQVLPGNITDDKKNVAMYTDAASYIVNSTDEEDSVFIICRGDDGYFLWHQRYYCSPRTIEGGSIGPQVDESDIWSRDMSVSELVDELKGYDYIYFCSLDDSFIDKYSEAFEDPLLVTEWKIYRLSVEGEKVFLEDN